MRGLVVGGMLAATMLAGGGAVGAQLDPEVAAYSAETQLLATMAISTLEDIAELSTELLDDIGDDEVLRDLMAETGVLEALYEAAEEIEPPASREASHEEFVESLRLNAEAAPLLREGYGEMDVEALEEAGALMEESREHLQEATRLLEAGE